MIKSFTAIALVPILAGLTMLASKPTLAGDFNGFSSKKISARKVSPQALVCSGAYVSCEAYPTCGMGGEVCGGYILTNNTGAARTIVVQGFSNGTGSYFLQNGERRHLATYGSRGCSPAIRVASC